MARHVMVLAAAGALAACPDDPNRPLGATCGSDSECESNLCYLSLCIDPAADDDLDTLTNGFEVGLDADPRTPDSDADGELDPFEAPGSVALDSDGDGRPDIIESLVDDADGDCIVDERDPDDDTPDPDGCDLGPVTSCDDVFRADPSRPSGPYTLDPDGPDGPEAALALQCLLGPAEGGAARFDPAVQALVAREGARQRRYLLVSSVGAWALSPPTTAAFDFTRPTHVAGTWFTSGAAGDGSIDAFVCGANAAAAAVGVGVGCFGEGGLAPSGEGVDAAAATLEVCDDGHGVFAGCAPATVYVRDERCPSDDGMLMDGELDALAAGERTCWKIESFDDGGGGLRNNVFADTDGARADHAPAVRADAYLSPVVPQWYVTFDHPSVPFARGHAYRLVFWARAAVERELLIEVGPVNEGLVEVLYVDTEWRPYTIDYAPATTSLSGLVRIFVGTTQSTTSLWLDSFSLHELGADACPQPAGDLVRGGGFDYGAACWERLRSGPDHHGELVADPEDAPRAAPSLRVEQRGDPNNTSLPYIDQRDIPLAAGHGYQLSFSARAAAERAMAVLMTSENALSGTWQAQPQLGRDWRDFQMRFYTEPDAGDPGKALLMFVLGGGDNATMWLDDVSLVDLGTDPCVARAPDLTGDAGFDLGTRCWSPATPAGTSIATVRDDEGSGSAPFLQFANTVATAIGDLAIEQRLALTAGPHTLSVRLRGHSDGRVVVVRVLDGEDTVILTERATLARDWTTYSFAFASPVADDGARVRVEVGGSDLTPVSLDDLRVRASVP